MKVLHGGITDRKAYGDTSSLLRQSEALKIAGSITFPAVCALYPSTGDVIRSLTLKMEFPVYKDDYNVALVKTFVVSAVHVRSLAAADLAVH